MSQMLQKRHGNAERLFPLKEVNNFSPSRINSLSNIDDAEIAGPRWCDIHPTTYQVGVDLQKSMGQSCVVLKIQIAKDSHIYHIYISYHIPILVSPKMTLKKTNWMLLGPFWDTSIYQPLSPTPESSDVLSPKEFHQTGRDLLSALPSNTRCRGSS